MVITDVNTMWFLPSALNVKVKRFDQARVNGGSEMISSSQVEALCRVLLYPKPG